MLNSLNNCWRDIGIKKRQYTQDRQSSLSLCKSSQKFNPQNRSQSRNSGKIFKINPFNHSNSAIIKQNRLNISKDSNSPSKLQKLNSQIQIKLRNTQSRNNILPKGQFGIQQDQNGQYSQKNQTKETKIKQNLVKVIKSIQQDFNTFKTQVLKELKHMEQKVNQSIELMLKSNKKQLQNIKKMFINPQKQFSKESCSIGKLYDIQIYSPAKKTHMRQSKSMNQNSSNNLSNNLFSASKEYSKQGQPHYSYSKFENQKSQQRKQNFSRFLQAVKMLKQDMNQMTQIGKQIQYPSPAFKGFHH